MDMFGKGIPTYVFIYLPTYIPTYLPIFLAKCQQQNVNDTHQVHKRDKAQTQVGSSIVIIVHTKMGSNIGKDAKELRKDSQLKSISWLKLYRQRKKNRQREEERKRGRKKER